MSTTLKIKITKEILYKSRFCSSMPWENCAISLAIRDILPNAAVCSKHIYPHGYEKETDKIRLPRIAKNFIREFDVSSVFIRENMPEIEFEIDIPDSVIERINIDEIKSLLVNHPTLEFV